MPNRPFRGLRGAPHRSWSLISPCPDSGYGHQARVQGGRAVKGNRKRRRIPRRKRSQIRSESGRPRKRPRHRASRRADDGGLSAEPAGGQRDARGTSGAPPAVERLSIWNRVVVPVSENRLAAALIGAALIALVTYPGSRPRGKGPARGCGIPDATRQEIHRRRDQDSPLAARERMCAAADPMPRRSLNLRSRPSRRPRWRTAGPRRLRRCHSTNRTGDSRRSTRP